MNISDKISTINLWGKNLADEINQLPPISPDFLPLSGSPADEDNKLLQLLYDVYFRNNWFTPYHTLQSLKAIVEHFLNEEKLKTWLEKYPHINNFASPKTIGLTMAGNLPLVGFHDLLCVLITGNHAVIKQSSKDNLLLPYVLQHLFSVNDYFKNQISYSEMLKGCDAYIATGSDNSARYFDYYFGKYPHIIRRNRTSVAVLTGDETGEELQLLCDDIFLYFGLGCRNVSKLIVPMDYDFTKFLETTKRYNHFNNLAKYKNNYDYQLTLLLMNQQPYWSSENLLLVETEKLHAPISVVYFERSDDATKTLAAIAPTDLQCIVGKDYLPFGKAQQPELWDYADEVDTMEWLMNLKLEKI